MSVSINFGNGSYVPSTETVNAVKTGVGAVVMGYVATKIVSLVASVAFTVLFCISAYKLFTEDKYRSDDILANLKNLATDTIDTVRQSFSNVSALFQNAAPAVAK